MQEFLSIIIGTVLAVLCVYFDGGKVTIEELDKLIREIETDYKKSQQKEE